MNNKVSGTRARRMKQDPTQVELSPELTRLQKVAPETVDRMIKMRQKIDNLSSTVEQYLPPGSKLGESIRANKGTYITRSYKIFDNPDYKLKLKNAIEQYAGKGKADADERDLSHLIVDALRGLKPKYFLFENVMMKQEHQDRISEDLGVQPIMINSADFSAHNRKRLYWTNIPIEEWEDKGIVLKDIVEDGMVDRDKAYCVDANYFKGGSMKMYYEKSRRQLVFDTKGCHQVGEADLKGYDIIKRVYATSGKSPALTTMQGGHREPKIVCGSVINRRINPDTGKRDDYNMDIPMKPRIETRADEKTGTLTTLTKDNVVVNHKEMYWRSLTPKECERLQTVPDGYTERGKFHDGVKSVSNSQRYKMLGNGWTVDVIAHIMKGME